MATGTGRDVAFNTTTGEPLCLITATYTDSGVVYEMEWLGNNTYAPATDFLRAVDSAYDAANNTALQSTKVQVGPSDSGQLIWAVRASAILPVHIIRRPVAGDTEDLGDWWTVATALVAACV